MTNYTTPPPPPAYPPPPAMGYPGEPGMPPAGRQTSGWSIASLVCGILGCVPFVTGALAVIFGVVGVRAARDPGVGGKGLAIAGIVLGAVSIVLWALFGAGIAALIVGTDAQREVARQFANDLAAGNVAAAQARCVPEMPAAQVQAAADAFKQWGTLRDTTIVGVKADFATGTGATTEVVGALKFDNATAEYKATLVKQGDVYKIRQFSFLPQQ